ncbi:MAG: hypothetical protein M1834_006831 [Cirrosporium novae-zelandiae]|nr:MAG: hypothetical protein M1834_006831 [Cirrosporium novae-zelandiae]
MFFVELTIEGTSCLCAPAQTVGHGPKPPDTQEIPDSSRMPSYPLTPNGLDSLDINRPLPMGGIVASNIPGALTASDQSQRVSRENSIGQGFLPATPASLYSQPPHLSNPQPQSQLGMMGVGDYGKTTDGDGWSGPWSSMDRILYPKDEREDLGRDGEIGSGCCRPRSETLSTGPSRKQSCCSRQNLSGDKPLLALSDARRASSASFSQALSSQNHGQASSPSEPASDPFLALDPRSSNTQSSLGEKLASQGGALPINPRLQPHNCSWHLRSFNHPHSRGYHAILPTHGLVGFSANPHIHSQRHAFHHHTDQHHCNCGDGCQCLGCATHPYNPTMQSRMQELGQIMDSMPYDHEHDPRPDNPADTFSMMNQDPGRGSISFHPPEWGFHMPGIPPTQNMWPQSDSRNPTSQNDPTLSPGYIYMEYPIGKQPQVTGCCNISDACRCGEDCACVGCLTHTGHNGVPLDVSTLESSSVDSTPQTIHPPGIPTQGYFPREPQNYGYLTQDPVPTFSNRSSL